MASETKYSGLGVGHLGTEGDRILDTAFQDESTIWCLRLTSLGQKAIASQARRSMSGRWMSVTKLRARPMKFEMQPSCAVFASLESHGRR